MTQFGGFMHGFGAQAWPLVYHEECINAAVGTAIAHLFQSLLQKHCIFVAHPPLPVT